MKVSELSGALLDLWVAKAEGFTGPIPRPNHTKAMDWVTRGGSRVWFGAYKPHRNWAQAGQIIEDEQIGFDFDGQVWVAWFQSDKALVKGVENQLTGSTPLIAAMRAFVASKYGESVPDEEVSIATPHE